MGQLRNKCVLELPSEAATNWTVWVTNSSHWFYVNGEPELCGNASGARSVGVMGYTYTAGCNSGMIQGSTFKVNGKGKVGSWVAA